jgi:cell division protein FtsI (penicillin-binding protein 3)
VVLRLVYLQVVNQGHYRELAQDQQVLRRDVPALRGTIYDRSGHVLAMTLPVETVVVNPSKLPNRAIAADLLAPILEVSAEELLKKIEAYAANPLRQGYMVVARNVDAERAGRLRRLGVDWITLESRTLRRYPNGPLAAQVLGTLDFQGQGNAGAEMQFEDDLSGHSGTELVTQDVRHRAFDSEVTVKERPGRNLVLTIDRRIQFVADQALARAVRDHRCDSGTAVVMDPYSGEILAISSYPVFDPNDPPEGTADARKNLAVSDPHEPGSVFKVFTIAAALETGEVRPETPFHCGNGVLNLFGRVIHEAKGGYGVLTVEEILAKSSNIGAIKVGMRMSRETLYGFLTKFGFNRPTGIDLPHESSGLVFRPAKWTPSSIGSVAMGHEVLTTTMQLARAASAIANNGLLVAPRLTRDLPVGAPQISNIAYTVETPPGSRVIKPETAIAMRRMMEATVLRGTGKEARLDGYSSGGKTGTAQMFDKAAKRYTHRYNASFMGFAPVTNPNVVVVVTLNGSTEYGGVIAAPVFKEIAETALRARNVPRDILEPEPADASESTALVDSGAEPIDTGQGAVLHEEAAVAVQDNLIALGPQVPDFSGKPVREVMEEAYARNLQVSFEGSGIARRQFPAPGTRLTNGQRIVVYFQK